MKHSIKLLVLFASSMVLQPVCAGDGAWAKKTAEIAWHTVQTLAGLFLVKNMTHHKCTFSDKPFGSRTGLVAGSRSFTLNPCAVPAKRAHAVKLAATVTLLYSGISGLNKDFKILKRIKKLKKKSKKVVKK